MKKAIAVLMLMPLVGCLTVGTKSKFYEDTETLENGVVVGTTHTEWTQKAKGGPFTKIGELKQDSGYSSDGGGDFNIFQGSRATDVDGSGQVTAFMAGADAVKAIGVARATNTEALAEIEDLKEMNEILHDVITNLEARIAELEQ